MTDQQPIRIEPGSEIARLLEQAGDGALTLEYAGRLYHIEPRPESSTQDVYDPAAAIASLRSGTNDADNVDIIQALSDILDLEE